MYLDDVYPPFMFKVPMCLNMVVRLNVLILLCPNPQDYCCSERAHIPASCSLQVVHIPASRSLQVMCIDLVAPLISNLDLYLDDVNLVAPHI